MAASKTKSEVRSDEPSIDEIVNTAADDKLPKHVRDEAYEQAMEFFLADENDLERNPLEDDALIYRIDLESGEEKLLVRIPIRTIDDAELKSLRQRSKERGPGGTRIDAETDDMRFYTLLCATAWRLEPQQRQRIVDKHMTLEHAMRKMLLPGERIGLAQHILAFSGFQTTVASGASAELEAAKN